MNQEIVDFPRLLIGPLYNPDVLGKYLKHPNIKLFMPRSSFTEQYHYDLVYEPEQVKHFNDIYAYLPDQWEPDLVIWWDIVYQTVIPGMSESIYPIALIPGDWNLAFSTVLHFSQCVDLVFADARLAAILRQCTEQCIIDWPNFAYDTQTIFREKHQRIYDISFIGNLETSIHPERSYYLNEILTLQDRYAIHISQGVWRADYRKILNQSKIVFNYTICQVLNMRAYEAPACGALLFIEEDNLEVRSIYQDGISCILYNQENLIERLVYYLEHELEREQIAEAGYQIALDYSYEASFERLLLSLPSKNLLKQKSQQRLLTASAYSELKLLYDLRQMITTNFDALQQVKPYLTALRNSLLNEGYFDLIQAQKFNALFAILSPTIDENQELLTLFDLPLEKFREIFLFLIKCEPENIVFSYHYALICEYFGKKREALLFYGRTIELLSGDYPELLDYSAFIVPFNKWAMIEPSVFFWEKVTYTAIERQTSPLPEYASILAAYVWRRIGKILEEQTNTDKATLAFENAYMSLTLAQPLIDLALLYKKKDSNQLLLKTLAFLLKKEPFCVRRLPEFINLSLYQIASAEIIKWVKPYLEIFTELKPLYFLALCSETAKRKSSQSQDWVLLLDFDISSDFYQNMHQLFHMTFIQNGLSELQLLKKSYYFSWQMLLEPAANIPSDCGLFWSSESADIIIGPSEEASWQRVYDQPTDFSQRLIGPDLFPYVLSKLNFVELDQSLKNLLSAPESYLLLLENDGQCLADILELADLAFESKPQIQLILWNPSRGLDIGRFQERLTKSRVSLSWLDEDFTLSEQGTLLSCSQLLVEPQGLGYYYAHWAWLLGRPVVWTAQPAFDAYIELQELYSHVPAGKESLFRSVDADLLDALQAALEAKQVQSQKLWLNGLWQIKVRQVLAG